MGRAAKSKTRTAFLAALGFGFFSIIALGGYGLFEQARYQREAQDQASDYAEHAARQIRQACVRVAAPEQAQCLANEQAEYDLKTRDNRREQDDLVAQRKSALWTFIMGMAALIGMALSAIGVILVKQTFDETRRTNRIAMRENARATRRAIASAKDTEDALAIAGRNADSAAAQVKVAQDIGEAQVRAYLHLAKVELCITKGGILTVHCSVKNSGRSPALDFTPGYRVCVATEVVQPSKEKLWSKLNKGIQNEEIAAGETKELVGWPYAKGLTPAEFGRAVNVDSSLPSLHIWLLISATWKDVFGKENSFRVVYLGWAKKWKIGERYEILPHAETRFLVRAEIARRKNKEGDD